MKRLRLPFLLTLRFVLPLCLLVVLFGFLWQGLRARPNPQPSFIGLLQQAVPAFEGKTLEETPRMVDEGIFTTGNVSVLNIWASWCHSCALEMPALFYLREQLQQRAMPVSLIGLNYRDSRKEAMGWLAEQGNPYAVCLHDPQGRLGLHFGIYGTPETFVIDQKGVIRERYSGALTQTVIEQHLLPLLDNLANKL